MRRRVPSASNSLPKRSGCERESVSSIDRSSVALPQLAPEGIDCVSANPVAKGDELLVHLEAVLRLTIAAHPKWARGVALSACPSPEPMAATRR